MQMCWAPTMYTTVRAWSVRNHKSAFNQVAPSVNGAHLPHAAS